MNNIRTMQRLLPPELIIDNYILNEEYSYEDYLVDFINCSSFFKRLSHGEDYQGIPKKEQNNGECDCVSPWYELDFKLLGTQSSLYASKNLSLGSEVLLPGLVSTTSPRQRRSMMTVHTHEVFRNYSFDDLLALDKRDLDRFDRDKVSAEMEVKRILNTVKCPKNVVLFDQFYFYTNDKSVDGKKIVNEVQKYIDDTLSPVFQFRSHFVPNKDTFLAVIIQGMMCFGVCDNEGIAIVDTINLSDSSTFNRIYQATSSAHHL